MATKKRIERVGEFEFTDQNYAKADVKFDGAEPVKAVFNMEYVSHDKPYRPMIHLPNQFTEAAKMFGVEFDTEDVVADFLKAQKAVVEKMEKKEQNRRRTEWDNSPLHALITEAKKIEGLTTKFNKSKEEYAQTSGYLTVKLTYKNISTTVEIEHMSKGAGWKYVTSSYRLFRESRIRRWNKPKSVIDKFVEAVEVCTAGEERKTEETKIKRERRDSVCAKLKELGFVAMSDERNLYHIKAGEFAIDKYDERKVYIATNDGKRYDLMTGYNEDQATLQVTISLEKLGDLLKLIENAE